MINYIPGTCFVNPDWPDTFRYPLAAGQRLHIDLATLDWPTDRVVLYVWSPDGERLLYRRIPRSSRTSHLLAAPPVGMYQIEVEGQRPLPTESFGLVRYRLSFLPLDGTGTNASSSLNSTEEGRLEPFVPLGSVPSRFIGLPSVPVEVVAHPRVYLAVVLRNYMP